MKSIKTNSPISVKQSFDVSSDALWELVSAPGNLNDSHPFCKSNEAIQWDEEGHIDRLVYLNGRTYIRQFLTWDEGEGYTLRIGCLLYTSPSPRDGLLSRMPSSA